MQHALHNIPDSTEDLSLSVASPDGEAVHLVKCEMDGGPVLHHTSHTCDALDLLMSASAEASHVQDKAGSKKTKFLSSPSGWRWTVHASR